MAKQHPNVSLLPCKSFRAEANTNHTFHLAHHQRVGLEPAAWPTVDHYLSSFDKAQYDQARFDRKPSLSEPPSQSHLPPQSLNYPNYTPYDPALSYDQSTPSLLQRSSQASSAQTSRQPAFPPLGLTSSGSCSPAGNHIPETEIRAQVLKQVATTAYEAFVKATPQIIDEVSPMPVSSITFASLLTKCPSVGVEKYTRYSARIRRRLRPTPPDYEQLLHPGSHSFNHIVDYEREETIQRFQVQFRVP